MIPETSPLWNFVGLRHEWDGEGSEAPSTDLLVFAQLLIDDLRLIFTEHEMPAVVPTRAGGFELVWTPVRGFKLQISLKADGRHSWQMDLAELGSHEGIAKTRNRLFSTAAVYKYRRESQ